MSVHSDRSVLVFPAWVDNPYLNLLSLAPRSRGVRFSGATTLASLLESAERLRTGDVLHLHWTSPIAQRAGNEAEARDNLGRFRTMLDALRRRGVHLVWTVHNQLPHELEYREVEIELYRLLAARADAVHVMAPETPQLLAGICDLDERRIHRVPHPSFAGVYGGRVPRSEARRRLGVAAEGPAVLFLGQIRPYKGLTVLFGALERMAETGPAPTLLLAGSADDSARRAVESTLPSGIDATVRFGFVPDADIPYWFSAADLAVFPYRAILNSGSVHLAAGFEVPVVLPGESHLRRQFADERWVGFYRIDDPVASLAEVMADSIAQPRAHDFTAFNEARTPWRISREYGALIDGLGPGRTGGGLPPSVPGVDRPR